jgi:branched-chain amino acid transport system substrate-binding protein
MNRAKRAMAAAVLVAASGLAFGGCGRDRKSGGSATDPILIGISLPLTGDFSQPGKGVQRGYERPRSSMTAAVCSAARSS